MRHFQKVCDVYDFFDADVLRVVTDHLKVGPSLRRRSWEFASIFLALERAGMLDGTRIGLGMGVGTERLIYALAPLVKQASITDLYETSSRWVAVRTENPKEMLKARAPWEVDWSKLDVRRMDMRSLQLPDSSVDFGWSTGSFEHIGEDKDFVRHLTEVHRVLKPGGIYAFTTAIAYEPKTVRFPNNYLFNPQHLVDLVEQSPLHGEPVFDCGVRKHALNEPTFEDLSEFGVNIPRQASPHVISYRRGIITTANLMILSKLDGPRHRIAVKNFEVTRKQMKKQADALLRRTWKDWQSVRVDQTKSISKTPFFHFGSFPVTAVVDADAGEASLVGRDCGYPLRAKTDQTISIGRDGRAEFNFDAKPNRIYAISARAKGEVRIKAKLRN